MKKILLIATGGTIASKATVEGLAPGITSEELLGCVPEIAGIADITARQLFNLDSTNIRSDHWLAIARTIREAYDGFDGFVITHGTDTMAYTAAALSYLIQKSPKPIVLTGSQKSIYLRDTDARNNLTDALIRACDDKASGVEIVFDGKVILGTRARKTRSKSFNAFSSIDYPEIARVRGGRLIRYITEDKPDGPVFYDSLDPKVFVCKLIPGADPAIFDYLADRYHGVVIESFGVGGIPCYGSEDFMQALERLLAAGVTVVITTQVSHEGSDMEVYKVGYLAKERLGLMEGYDMTPEAIAAKLMWILGRRDRSPLTVRRLFYTPVAHDILE